MHEQQNGEYAYWCWCWGCTKLIVTVLRHQEINCLSNTQLPSFLSIKFITIKASQNLFTFIFIEKDVPNSCQELETKKKFWVPMRIWTSDIWIPHFSSLKLQFKYSISWSDKPFCYIHHTCILHSYNTYNSTPTLVPLS